MSKTLCITKTIYNEIWWHESQICCKVTTPELCPLIPLKTKTIFIFTFNRQFYIKTLTPLSFIQHVIYLVALTELFLSFFLHLRQICKAEVGDLCCHINPMSYVSTAPSGVCVAPNKIKALVEMGHPPTSCVCVERTPRVGAVCVCRHRSACACVYMSCQVVAALRLCEWRSVCIRVRFDI